MKKHYTVETLRAGQPRAYADSEYECLITITAEHYGDKELKPWLYLEDVEERIRREEADRKAGRMAGGQSPEQLRKGQREWALRLVRALFRNCREKGDDDGRSGMEAYFYPTLKSLSLDPKAGTIRALIIEPFTD